MPCYDNIRCCFSGKAAAIIAVWFTLPSGLVCLSIRLCTAHSLEKEFFINCAICTHLGNWDGHVHSSGVAC